MIAPRRPPSSRPFLAAPRTDFYHPARAIDAAHAALQGVVFDETCAARSQDFLYDEDGLPA
jgi:hypothetical protein